MLPQKTEVRVSELDLFRFIAAMAVLLYHYTFRGHAADNLSDLAFPELAPVTQYGFLGVELFFMISGFVILMTASSGSLARFAASRVSRLYPAYWVACTLTFAGLLLWGQERFPVSLTQWLVNLSMFNEFVNVPSIDGVYWTLAVEIKFYLMVAVVLALGHIHRVEQYLLAWLGVALVLAVFPSYRLSSWLIAGYAPCFVLGALAYLVHTQGWTRLRAGAVLVAWLLAVKNTVDDATRHDAQYHTTFEPWVVGTLVSVFALLMLLTASRKLGWLGRLRWSWLGVLTYPLYLVHQNLGYVLFNRWAGQVDRWLLLLGVTAAMLLLAWLLHVLVERPLAPALRRGFLRTAPNR